MASEILGLQWTEHSKLFNQAIVSLRGKNLYSDATLACEGKFFPVHKFVLSTCSNYFSAIFDITPCLNPVIVINNVSCRDLESLLNFMYCGETSVHEKHIQDVMKAADCLHIKGLTVNHEPLFSKAKINDKLPSNDQFTPEKNRSPLKKTPCALTRNDVHMQPQTHLPDFSNKMVHGQSTPTMIHQSTSFCTSSPISARSPICQSVSTGNPSILPPIATFSNNIPLSLTNNMQLAPKQHILMSQPTPPMQEKVIAENKPTTDHHRIEMNSSPLTAQQLSDLSFGPDAFSILKQEETSTISSDSLPLNNGCPTPKENVSFRDFQSSSLCSETNPKSTPEVQLPTINDKILNDDFHLERTVKELEITTEDGTVTIPDLLEGFVDMKNLYDDKVSCDDSEDFDSKASHLSNASQDLDVNIKCSSSPVGLLPFKEETNDTLYDFTEDLPDNSTTFSKESSLKNHSRANSSLKRELDEVDSEDEMPFKRRTRNSPVPSTSVRSPVEGRFVCNTCSRVCKKKDSLTRHMRTHEEYPYKCTLCNFKCKQHKDYAEHFKRHADISCDKCNYTTNRKENLRRHMRSHDAKTLKCTFDNCHYAFHRPHQLKTHLMTHKKKLDTD